MDTRELPRLGIVIAAIVASTAMPGTIHTASAATAVECTVSGSMQVTPGEGLVPQAESYSYSGSSDCFGVVADAPALASVGAFSGSILCELGSIELDAGCGSQWAWATFAESLTCTGTIVVVRVGPVLLEVCTLDNSGVETGIVVLSGSPIIQFPETSLDFTGETTLTGAG